MSTKKKGMLATDGDWCKHLRKDGKRVFWKKHRGEEGRLCKGQEDCGEC